MPKTVRLNATHYFILNIPNKRELQQIASNHSSNMEFKDFMKLYKDYTKEPYSFLVNETTLSSDNPLRLTLEEPITKLLLARNSKQSITKLSKTRLNTI